MENNIHKYTNNYLRAIIRYKKENGVYNPIRLEEQLSKLPETSNHGIPWPTRIALKDKKWNIISYFYLKDDIKNANLNISYNTWLGYFERGFSHVHQELPIAKLFYNEKKA